MDTLMCTCVHENKKDPGQAYAINGVLAQVGTCPDVHAYAHLANATVLVYTNPKDCTAGMVCYCLLVAANLYKYTWYPSM